MVITKIHYDFKKRNKLNTDIECKSEGCILRGVWKVLIYNTTGTPYKTFLCDNHFDSKDNI